MHQLRTRRTARALKLGAAVLILTIVAALTTAGMMGFSFYSGDRELAIGSLGCFGFTLFLLVFYRILASYAHCPLCRGPVLSKWGAQRNREAKRLAGSYRLRVARDIVLTNTFQCPYCAESTRCVVKERPVQLKRKTRV